MTAGFQSFRVDGPLQFDSDLPSFSLLSKGTTTCVARVFGNSNVSSVLIPIPDLTNPYIISVSSTFQIARAGSYTSNNQSYQHYVSSGAIGSTVSYWIFAPTSTFGSTTNMGLEIMNSSSQVTYSTGKPVCRVAAVATSAGQTFNLDSSRTYAMASQEWVGFSQPSGEYYKNGQVYRVGEDAETGPANTVWAYLNSGKMYGTSVNGGTCVTGQVGYDDVRRSRNVGTKPIPITWSYVRPMGITFILDVTGY